jgi:hypothetical protein
MEYWPSFTCLLAPRLLGDCVAMLQISADVMLRESEASAFSSACEKQMLRLSLRMTF